MSNIFLKKKKKFNVSNIKKKKIKKFIMCIVQMTPLTIIVTLVLSVILFFLMDKIWFQAYLEFWTLTINRKMTRHMSFFYR